ncbi:alpha/beta fold hydrolase [Novosphingobium sp. 9]|uniref:alpha/beta fold hydrolase n=1 Tax=Novosphingobium sp. 9 TaxID=2025349 RepID=UPI0021B69044|nr:alpha/beta hydrolase [Novosphingobium sp. 9]
MPETPPASNPAATDQVACPDGRMATVYHWRATVPVKGVVLIAHGMGEHALRYDRFARALAAAGYEVHAPDQRGHGPAARDDGTLADLGPDGFPALTQDHAALILWVREHYGDLPLILFGHSMGSMMLQQLILDTVDPGDAVILCGSTAVDRMGEMMAASKAEGGPFAAFNAAFQPVRTGADWLSRDEREVDLYLADPLCGFAVTPASFASLLAQGEHLRDPAALEILHPELPILIFSGDMDPIAGPPETPRGAIVRELTERYRAAGLRRVTLKLYPEGRHEMLNEINREDVTGDVLGWIAANVG